jgi:hypothetical protein
VRGLVLAVLVSACPALADGVTIEASERECTVVWGGQPVLTYHTLPDAMKPLIHPFLTPAGHSVTADSPASNPHHHGLWLTWGYIDRQATGERVNFWTEVGDPAGLGRIVRKAGTAPVVEITPRGVSITTENEWQRASDGRVLLTERRQVRVHPADTDSAHLVTIISEQTAAEDLVIRKESNEQVSYYGMCVQLPPDMNNGLIVNANGAVGRAAATGDAADWCAYATSVTPARGIALFDHPANPRHPAQWFLLDGASGFMSVSLVAGEDYPLKAGETLKLCYGALAFDGEPDAEFIGKQYRRWRRLQLRAEINEH